MRRSQSRRTASWARARGETGSDDALTMKILTVVVEEVWRLPVDRFRGVLKVWSVFHPEKGH
jgi:ABC-type antimicrobial peptide transport system ATPase subunit